MSESWIQLPPDSTGKKVRSIERTIGSDIVYSEVMSIVDSNGTVISPLSEGGTISGVNVTVGTIDMLKDGSITVLNPVNTITIANPVNTVLVSNTISTNILNSGIGIHCTSINVGNSTVAVVGAVASKMIKVYNILMVANAPSTIFWSSNNTLVSGTIIADATGWGYAQVINPPAYLLTSAPGATLNLTCLGGTIGGYLSYWDDDIA